MVLKYFCTALDKISKGGHKVSPSSMWVVVGLGNPGKKYFTTRHNIGFRVIDRLSEKYGIPLEEKDLYMIGKGVMEGINVILLKPLTFMNRSGLAVKKILKKANISADNLMNRLIVVHDDLDIDVGIIKIRRGGSSGGHRGIESIIQELGTKDFVRIKIGIGRDKTIPVEEYVLQGFKSYEKNLVEDVIILTSHAVTAVVTEGIDKAMNKYNRSQIKIDKTQSQ
ncbi:peptidyl-tRNA hydrolase [Dissulfurispira thermophila]|uniref:Peptidyl-tRNA hydrolase n=1 Tax=Dissulfurispira thermophila TaxID=2715679 RepID=A0A7G1H0U9_9BACT|nr:aminoacyl-tRNA hydrolase [Dissulfurispira thermophila]BCB96374.1 peptidyl-tRNA hydrolase [Dissulfurispira thermophila]